MTPAAEAVRVPAHLVLPRPLQVKQLCHLHAQSSLGQSCHRQKMSCVYACRVASVVSTVCGPLRLFVALCDSLCPARLLCQRGRFYRQEYWSILANTGRHTLLEHYISCCPSCQPPLSTWCCQNPCNPSSCTTSTPGPHRGKPKSSRAASGANPSGRPTCRGGNKTTIETQGQCG